MNKLKNNNNVSKKQYNGGPLTPKKRENVASPTLYSSIIQTESKMRNISISHLELKPMKKVVLKEVNFPLNEKMFNYSKMVDVGLNSGNKVISKQKPREVHLMKTPEPKLSDYYRPNFENVQRIQLGSVKTEPELTIQYDGLAVSRLLNEIDDLVFK